MTGIKFKKQIASTCIMMLLLTGTSPLLTASEALAARPFDFFGRLKRFFTGSRPRGVASGRQRGGGRRDRCPHVPDPLIAIVPFDRQGKSFVEKTISERPVFWFYVPYLPTAQRKAEFVIIDENEEDVYVATLPLSQQPGIVSLQLPPSAPSLKDGKKYQWVFSVICNPLNRSGDATVNGWLEKVPVSIFLREKLNNAEPKDLVAIYAEENLWYEALTAFANFGKTNPQDEDFQSSWRALQRQLDLNQLSSPEWITYNLPNPSQGDDKDTKQSQPLPSLIPVEKILEILQDEIFLEDDT